jgi:hypothetical protein
MGTATVDQAKLVLNTFVTVLKNNLVSRDVVNWNEHAGELDDLNKLQVVEQVAPRYNVTRTTNGVKDLTAGTDGSVFGSEMFVIDGTFNANMGFGDFVKIRDVGQARESQALIGAATSMAEKIDAYVLQIATLASDDWLGTAGNPIALQNDAISAYTRLKESGVSDNDLFYVMNYMDQQLLGNQIITQAAMADEASKTYRQGFDGKLGGIPALFTQQLPVLTTGTRAITGAAAVNGANQNVDYATVAKAGASNGLHKTQTLILSAAGAGATIKAGEVFTVPNVFAYDNRKQALVNPARLQQFTVVADATADGAGAVTVTVFPAMIVPGAGAGDNININTAHATVNAAPANGAVLTWIGAASTAFSPRLLIQKGAITVNTIPLIMPATGTAMRKSLNGIPLSVRMWQHSDFATGAHSVRFDVAMNANIRSRDRLARFNGS